MDNARRAGRALRAMREANQLTQLDVERRSNGLLTNVRVSRIETGALRRPPMADLVAYGQVLGLTPTDVAALYGYWEGTGSQRVADEPRLVRARLALSRLDAKHADDLLRMIDLATTIVVSEALLYTPDAPTEAIAETS